MSRIAEERLLAESRRAVPFLQQASDHPDLLVRARARELAERIRLQELAQQLQAYAAQPDDRLDLEEGAFLVAIHGYPDVDAAAYGRRIDDLASRVAGRLTDRSDFDESIDAINETLFVREGFHIGEADDSGATRPDDIYLNRVIDTGSGSSIALSTLYVLVARRLDLQLAGLDMPAKCVVRGETPDGPVFIDPERSGGRLSRGECMQVFIKAGAGFQERFLGPTPVRRLIDRMLHELARAYSAQEDPRRAERLKQYRNLLLGA